MSTTEQPAPPAVRWGIRITGALAMLIGAFWLAAWFTGYAVRWTDIITVKTNMALAQLCGGTALLLLCTGRPSNSRRVVGTSAAIVVLLVGAVTLSEHLFGWNPGIDQLLAKEPPGARGTFSPNRIGPPGSLSLTLLGIGLLVLALRRRWIIPYLGIAVCAISLIPAVGYIYGVGAFYQLRLTGIAWPTVIALTSLGIGLVLSRTERGPIALLLRDDAGGRLLRRMLPWVIILPLAFGFVRVRGQLHGLYDTASGSGVLAIVTILIFSTMLWRSARSLSRSDVAHREDEEALRESEERYRQLIQNTTAIILRMHPDARITFANDRALKFFGYPAEELIGHHAVGTIVPERESTGRDLARMVDEIAEDPDRFHSNVNENMRKNGERVWLEWTNSGIYDSDGRLTGVLCAGIDVTDKVLAQQQLDKAESEKLDFYRRTILAATDDKLVIAERYEIEEIAGPAVKTWGLHDAEGIRAIRHAVEDEARSSGIDQPRLGQAVIAVGEAVTNAIKHAPWAEVSFHRTDDSLIVVVSDSGPGIPSHALPDVALRPGYSTAGTLGMGYKVMLRFADRVYLATGPEGTMVGIMMDLCPSMHASGTGGGTELTARGVR